MDVVLGAPPISSCKVTEAKLRSAAPCAIGDVAQQQIHSCHESDAVTDRHLLRPTVLYMFAMKGPAVILLDRKFELWTPSRLTRSAQAKRHDFMFGTCGQPC